MDKNAFESLLDDICSRLPTRRVKKVFTSASRFENRARLLMHERSRAAAFQIDLNPHPQAFPDIAVGECGVEVRLRPDTWRAVGNSIQENQRIETVRYIYHIFGKMGNVPDVRWARV